jgi:hypothetical protein
MAVPTLLFIDSANIDEIKQVFEALFSQVFDKRSGLNGVVLIDRGAGSLVALLPRQALGFVSLLLGVILRAKP